MHQFVGARLLSLVVGHNITGCSYRNGAVINLYAEASNPSYLGAASGVLVTSDCSTKECLFNCMYRLESAK